MPRKTIIIFISVFIIVGAIMLGVYFWRKSSNNTDTSGGGGEYQSFNPFGSSGTNGGTPNTETGGADAGEIIVPPGESGSGSINRFRKIAEFSIAGGAFFEDTRLVAQQEGTKETKPQYETVPSIRYVERATGHIYQMYLDNGTSGKISNSTVPSIYEALFDSKASSLIYRYLATDNQTITTFMATLGAPRGEFLPINITDITLSPDKSRFFYLTKSTTGVTGSIRSFTDTKKTQIFTSPFTEWLSQWVSNEKIYLTTKASYGATGSLFSLNTNTGTLSKILGPLLGLTTLGNNTGTRVLYSTAENRGPYIRSFDATTRAVTDIGLYTLPEKCVWSSDSITAYCAVPNSIIGSQYPDGWYQGQISFDDRIVKINTITGTTATIANSLDETPVDATHLFLDKKESLLFFTNKKDSTFWALDIK